MRVWRNFIIFLLLMCLTYNASAVTVKDSAGNTVEIDKAERIVCLSGDCLEAVIILGAKERIVGLGSYALQKPYAPKVADVGKWSDPNIEAIISLKPDVVITYVQWPEKEKLEEKLKGTGIKVVRLDLYKINTIFDEFITLGKILGKEDKAKEIADYWRSQLDLIKSRVESLEKVRVYWESYSDYSAAGNGTGWNEILLIAGGINVFDEKGYPKVDAEKIISKNPEVFIKSISSSVFQPLSDDRSKLIDVYEKLRSRPEIAQIDAGKNGKVYVVCMDYLHSTFGLIAEVAYVAKILHPEHFSDLNPEELHRKYIESLGISFNGTWIYPDLSQKEEQKPHSTPGFEVISAVLALMFALRRHDRL
ncbi:MAG: iron complex transport system substrate-binding protein [Archaeoglobaceae archaeon]|nr:iron complex transport system substrate-binding protein [Archaeoglobaceae archaeon]MDK2876714.1 iron complex transport system substrate-binding protein [Archaeoglobaceae archaeon]